jgi:general secretion pathway protein C
MWVANTGVAMVAAFFGAEGLGAVARVALPPASGISGVAAQVAPAERKEPARSAARILERNPFDSLTGSLVRSALAEENALAPVDPTRLPDCQGVRVVVIAASGEPDDLAAFLVDGARPVVRRRGGVIGGLTVELIAPDRVFLRDARRPCQARLFPSAAPLAPLASKTHPTDALDPSLATGIERVGPGSYRVERRVVDRVLDDQSEVMRGGMMRPEKEGDRVVGIRLFGVRPDRLFGVLGLEDGDVLSTINGFPFSSPERMLDAYARLRGAAELEVDFTRGGRPMRNTYSVQ